MTHRHSMTVFTEPTEHPGVFSPVAMCGSCSLYLRGSYQIETYIEKEADKNAAMVAALETINTIVNDDALASVKVADRD